MRKTAHNTVTEAMYCITFQRHNQMTSNNNDDNNINDRMLDAIYSSHEAQSMLSTVLGIPSPPNCSMWGWGVSRRAEL